MTRHPSTGAARGSGKPQESGKIRGSGERGVGRPKDPTKRDAMMDAAACLFFQHGLDGVTMEAVAREAGVSKVTVYGHFSTKEALFGSVIRRETEKMRQGLECLPDTTEGLRQSLIDIGMGITRFLMQPHVLAVERVIAMQGEQHPKLVRAFFEAGPWATCQWLQEQLCALEDAGLIRLPDAAQAADQLCSMWQGMLVKEMRMAVRPPPSDEELHRQVSAAVELFIEGYGNDTSED
ncbi:TetR/AcrR family transcriptional regulator [Halomonas urumqiensis]|uniref:TetR/AcrR family transcriptional regulator n=1 Tax=Halomonas urumqiensis TaxID=1684789 RepID=A0A2N7UDC4_9GAMM|nr:TetR/AcrR family transcriptional regulator [Halomonas urumqiensis]PMR78458.1 TetR/AcrR family transcriptional regulator [Halomonas urumqiensis]PTB03603.1 TetR/AcrR family transcriptional regulator [Halomonas urumqiensis]GHE20191.1 transcriptional regulator [Halomonas urumqiensis]